MTYQVLARKWRPKTFAELSGQEHVVTALTNALQHGRLHHAYLLTGTRGVGKTTIARILAKCLNCATGVTATPCGVCAACTEIDAGRFIDLLELDAASNTGIDNMREILDNARYAPTAGRYKVYLIDEVHMLSKAAFNSMLKTLEEPPEHVKFVLATTDPQKIPVTVLSRCLQFNLKQLPAALIAARLGTILEEEKIAAEAPALALIARAAHGSMRDALSLLDQAIAYGGGEVREPIVRNMLGAVDTDYLYRLLDAVINDDGAALIREADAMSERSMAFASALDELASLLHRIAIAQVVPSESSAMDDAARITDYAARMSPAMVQLAYQICVQGRADLALAPDEATGFVMTLLRLLAFEPAGENRVATEGTTQRQEPSQRQDSSPAPARPRIVDSAARAVAPAPQATADAITPVEPKRALPTSPDAWPTFVSTLALSGIVGQLASQTELIRSDGREVVLGLPEAQRHLTDKAYVEKLKAALEQATGGRLKLAFELRNNVDVSLAAQDKRQRAEQKAQTEAAFREEPFVRDVLTRFEGKIRPDSIKRE